MEEYTKEELAEALRIICSIISRCEKAQLKFTVGTSQHSLLRNRLKAMYIARALIIGENISAQYTKEELSDALRPISSSLGKCEKAQLKFAVGTSQHSRFIGMIKALYIAKALVSEEISKRA